MNPAQRGVAAFALSALALGACASNPRVSPPVRASPALATVTGTVRIYGGPIRRDGTMPLNGNAMMAVAPVVVTERGRITQRSSTDAEGHYRLELPAGTYAISAGCSQPISVVLRAGERLAHDLRCDVA
jgi:hypothetical protein